MKQKKVIESIDPDDIDNYIEAVETYTQAVANVDTLGTTIMI